MFRRTMPKTHRVVLDIDQLVAGPVVERRQDLFKPAA
jgi:hypothetical protein